MRPALFVLCLAAAGGAAADLPRITEIEIRTDNVFSPAEAASAFFPYRLANALHAETRKSLIEKYLLFHVGDPLDPDQLAETERNLRATGIFRYAVVRSLGTKVIVETGDAWTLLLEGALSGKGGFTSYSFGAEEKNLLGTGRQVEFLYDRGTQRISRSFTFADPTFLRPYTLLNVVYSNLSDGTYYQGSLQRPFFALDTPWAAGLAFQQNRFEPKVYAGGEEAANYSERQLFFRADGGLRVSRSNGSADRILGFVDFNDTTVTAGPFGPAPPEPALARRFFFIGTGVQHDAQGWIQRTDVDRIGLVEDFNLAPVGQIQLGFSPEVFGATGAARMTVRGSMGTLLPSGFSLATVSAETRYENGPQNTIVNLDVRAILQVPAGTLVARIGLASGWRPDPEVQIYLDGSTGVRGYRLQAVSATGRLVGNFELRHVFFRDVLHLVSIGAATFFDTGVTWGPPDGSWRLADAGVGLRFGLTRASQTTLLRVDFARAFDPDPLGRTGWLVSFASSQAF